ncbi:MAG: DUF5320 domain-containing protein [Candidatus Methanofastidiosia archaeon]
MPRGDRTGPLGEGPMTGRAAGYCAGYSTPGFANPVPGCGFWGRGFRGRGGGRGYRQFWRVGYPPRYYVPPYSTPSYPAPVYPAAQVDPKEEIKYLEEVATSIKKELEAVEARMKELQHESE